MARSSDSSFLLSILKDKTFQAREIRRVIKFASLYLVITTVLVGIFYHLTLSKLVAGAAPLFFVSEDIEMFNQAIPGITSVLAQWVVIMLAVNLIITAIIATYILRKLGHPILAIKRALRQIGEGDLDVRLRATDDKDFGEISESLNEAMETIRRHIAEAKNEIGTLKELQNSPAANASDVESALQNCHEALNFFKADKADDSDPQRTIN